MHTDRDSIKRGLLNTCSHSHSHFYIETSPTKATSRFIMTQIGDSKTSTGYHFPLSKFLESKITNQYIHCCSFAKSEFFFRLTRTISFKEAFVVEWHTLSITLYMDLPWSKHIRWASNGLLVCTINGIDCLYIHNY